MKKVKLKPIKQCKTVQELLAAEKRWTTGWFAKNKDGGFVSCDSKQAVCFCLIGATERIYGDKVYKMLNKFVKVCPEATNIPAFNDQFGYETVYKYVKKAKI